MQRLIRNKLLVYSLILGFFGFLDSSYLTISHYKNITPPCTIHGCEQALKLLYAATAWGIIFSVYLLAVQGLVLHAFCQYCLLSEVISLGLFILSLLKIREDRTLPQ